MNENEEKLRQFMRENNVQGQHLTFTSSCHTVQEAARAVNAAPEDFVKNVCLVDDQGNLIVAIVKGEDRVSTSRVGSVLGIPLPRVATPEEILQKTGYPCGGVPSFGYEAKFLIDPKVMERDFVYTGGGSTNSLVKISPGELARLNKGEIVRIRK